MNVRLPAPARAKLSELERTADDAAALANATFGSLKTIEKQMAARLSALESNDGDEARAEKLKAEVQSLGNEAERLRVVLTERQSRRDAAQQILTRVGDWIDRVPPNVTLEMVGAPKADDASPREAVEKHRQRIGKLRAEMEKVRRAPLPTPDIKRMTRAFIDTHAARGRPRIQVDGDRVDVVFENTKALVRGDRYGASLSADTLVWLFRDELAAALDREVDALAVVGGLTRDERAARLEALRADLLEAEHREEAAIMRAREEGTVIARRAEPDPRAVLGIRFVGAAASQAA